MVVMTTMIDDWWVKISDWSWFIAITMTSMMRLSRMSRSRWSISCLHQYMLRFSVPCLAPLASSTDTERHMLWQFSVEEPSGYPRSADQSPPIAGNLVTWMFCHADSTRFALTWSKLRKWRGKCHARTSRSPSCFICFILSHPSNKHLVLCKMRLQWFVAAKLPKIDTFKDQYIHGQYLSRASSSWEHQDWEFNSSPRPRAERAKKAAEAGCQHVRNIRICMKIMKGISARVNDVNGRRFSC